MEWREYLTAVGTEWWKHSVEDVVIGCIINTCYKVPMRLFASCIEQLIVTQRVVILPASYIKGKHIMTSGVTLE